MSDFRIKFIDEIAIIKVDILIATHRDTKPLWDELESKLIFHRKKIIIDLSFCNNVDSTFIGMIIKILRKVNEKNGQLILVFPKRDIIKIFSMTGVDKLITCYNTLQEALDCFGYKSAIKILKFDRMYSTN